MNRKNLSAILRCAVATAFLVLYVMAYIAFEKTVVEWWKPAVVGACAIAVTGMTKMTRWRWLTATDDRTLNGLFHVYAVGAMAVGVFLLGNYWLPVRSNGTADDSRNSYSEKVVVETKEIVERDKTQRVGRHRYRKTGVRYEYYIGVVFGNGMRKDIPVTRSVYNRTRQGAPTELLLDRGLFGMPVVRKVGACQTIQDQQR